MWAEVLVLLAQEHLTLLMSVAWRLVMAVLWE